MMNKGGFMGIKNLLMLKEQVNIVDVIGYYIPLKKDRRSYTALCPFHNEDTPSFKVGGVKNIFKCFGCNKSGDAFSFVQEYSKLDFIESCKQIANIIGFTLEYDDSKVNNNLYEMAYQANTSFLEYCHSRKSAIQDLLLNRGLDLEIIDTFKLGFSGESFEIKK